MDQLQTRRRLNYEKCTFCRKDKKKVCCPFPRLRRALTTSEVRTYRPDMAWPEVQPLYRDWSCVPGEPAGVQETERRLRDRASTVPPTTVPQRLGRGQRRPQGKDYATSQCGLLGRHMVNAFLSLSVLGSIADFIGTGRSTGINI